jgi:hypothetical protein
MHYRPCADPGVRLQAARTGNPGRPNFKRYSMTISELIGSYKLHHSLGELLLLSPGGIHGLEKFVRAHPEAGLCTHSTWSYRQASRREDAHR